MAVPNALQDVDFGTHVSFKMRLRRVIRGSNPCLRMEFYERYDNFQPRAVPAGLVVYHVHSVKGMRDKLDPVTISNSSFTLWWPNNYAVYYRGQPMLELCSPQTFSIFLAGAGGGARSIHPPHPPAAVPGVNGVSHDDDVTAVIHCCC